jgi:hypothetical protein
MQGRATETFLAIMVVISVVAFWCAIIYLISLITGWQALARRFRAQSEPYGDAKTAGPFFYTIYMRYWGHYSSVIRLTAAADALYTAILFPFRFGHPPLRIPWNEIRFSTTQRFAFKYAVLTLGNEEKIPMRISGRMARNLGILDRFPAS